MFYVFIAALISFFSLSSIQAGIPSVYYSVAQNEGVPVKILYAMALAESGKYYKSKLLPWPWTTNISGQGIYCVSQAKCINLSREAIGKGKSVDINIMQVNWHWHHHRFSSLEAAWEPMVSLSVGAEILREHFERTKDWWLSVGLYHSPANKLRAKAYRERVQKHWRTLE